MTKREQIDDGFGETTYISPARAAVHEHRIDELMGPGTADAFWKGVGTLVKGVAERPYAESADIQ